MRRGRDLRAQHEGILRIHDGMLGRAPGELARVRDVPLVELVVAGHEHGGGASVGASGPAGLLPHRRERSGEAVEHHRVEAADVDAELERVGCGDAEHPAAREVELERPALRREVTGAIRGNARAKTGLELFEASPRVLRDHLRAAATPGECECGMTGPHEA